ncbi:hypothetical protein HFP15_11290 [Amycolatopsis sp. K13G38]|uniref:Uncharacterized protein n=1 Tax=Amycolatopsis acididurans TaxID=2724524 RepID=A0ABX1J1D5_9PSEU|nr:hypothetical protein [Amycolatopsis acididurans]NKQ53464.1 hypothetical protein [Amycolatopsis acididurans]
MRIRRNEIPPDETSPEETADERSRRPYVVGAVAGFVIGASVIGLLWAVSGAGDGAAEDARAACAALAKVVQSLPSDRTQQAALPSGVVSHAIAARELSAAAADGSAVYEDLADHLDGVSRMVISLNLADPAGRHDLTLALQDCARV